jgi:hypothetical protein
MKLAPILNNSTEVAEVLAMHNALLVHCAGYVWQGGNAVDMEEPMARLRKVITERCNVSCSTLVSGDSYRCNDSTNLTGPVGLILDPGSMENITSAHFDDNGTMRNGCKGRTLLGGGAPPNIPLSEAIIKRPKDRYNEICTHSYDVLGLIVCEPLPAKYRAVTSWTLDEDGDSTPQLIEPTYSASKLRSVFPDLPLYFWHAEKGLRPHLLARDGELHLGSPICSAEIYGLQD